MVRLLDKIPPTVGRPAGYSEPSIAEHSIAVELPVDADCRRLLVERGRVFGDLVHLLEWAENEPPGRAGLAVMLRAYAAETSDIKQRERMLHIATWAFCEVHRMDLAMQAAS